MFPYGGSIECYLPKSFKPWYVYIKKRKRKHGLSHTLIYIKKICAIAYHVSAREGSDLAWFGKTNHTFFSWFIPINSIVNRVSYAINVLHLIFGLVHPEYLLHHKNMKVTIPFPLEKSQCDLWWGNFKFLILTNWTLIVWWTSFCFYSKRIYTLFYLFHQLGFIKHWEVNTRTRWLPELLTQTFLKGYCDWLEQVLLSCSQATFCTFFCKEENSDAVCRKYKSIS